MPKLPHLFLASLAASAMLLVLSGCGDASRSTSSVAHIERSSATISKATLNHWMQALAGQDFRQGVRTEGPSGLASEPANYSACVSAASKVVPRSSTGQLLLNETQITQDCHALYRAIKEQALSFLISTHWNIVEGQEQGLKVSNALLRSEFARYRKQVYPTEADLQKYLAERHWILSDVLYQLKDDILSSKLLPKFAAKVKQAGGGTQANVTLALKRYKGLIARTSCSPGYVVPTCKQYRGTPMSSQSGEAILEALARGES